ncbi:MAG: NAD-dependent epimerase/dehydratase family protein [Puniceicoccaceae bacterium]
MKILVTGANGFVGSHVLESLAKIPGIEVIAACRNPSRLLPAFRSAVRVGDLRDAAYVNHVVEGIDQVVHAAAWSALWGHQCESRELFLNPSLALLEAAKRAGVKRFHFASTLTAAPSALADDAMQLGVERKFWPHEANVVKIENRLRALSDAAFQGVVMRLGFFVGRRYSLGILPILVPKLRARLVPWVGRGMAPLPLVDGRDIAAAFAAATQSSKLGNFESFNIVGPEIPLMREVVEYLHEQHAVPLPMVNVSYPVAYAFAWLMEQVHSILPGDPLLTRSLVHLITPRQLTHQRAAALLGYQPQCHWKETIDLQMQEMKSRSSEKMRMFKPLPKEAI